MKGQIIFKGIRIRLITDFSTEMVKQEENGMAYAKRQTANLEFIQEKTGLPKRR